MMQISGLLNLPFKLEEMIRLWILHCYICLLLLTGFLSSWKRYFLGETRNNPVVPPLVDQDSKSLSGHIRAEETETVPPSLTSQPWTVPPSLSSQQWTLPPSLISQPWTAAVKMKCCSQNYLLFHCRKYDTLRTDWGALSGGAKLRNAESSKDLVLPHALRCHALVTCVCTLDSSLE